MPLDDADHRAILARRTALIASALAAVGCGGPAAATPPPSGGEVPIPPPPDAQPVAPAPAPTPGEPAPATPTGTPGFDVPSGITDTAKENYDRLYERMKSLYGLLDKAEDDVPESCPISRKDCEPKWKALAEHFHAMDHAQTFSYHCPGSSAEAQAFGKREQEHRDFYAARYKLLEEKLNKALAPSGEAGTTRWEEIKADVYAAKPFPCLSYGCQDW